MSKIIKNINFTLTLVKGEKNIDCADLTTKGLENLGDFSAVVITMIQTVCDENNIAFSDFCDDFMKALVMVSKINEIDGETIH